ncbi:uncharacterized protein MONOS_11552 [Monocercomonoides exilis]|uniref:uncharacterized protein n=1 Tax=Monocercomonoides exilis TaxID=2049356 RepID=UPI003559551B|nr:hypothetical protein MONOS_11552 [Monocercomonoides exilis]|eukprot:MONOS_11552.1-p1 / transcript=MONOS_11552.1 / gene=MONOS_11552 / organism=Monocercomonoides_exilis_PA203 / gene_product=unspecified product / transcript_product=unspecified product / location=Mono_scaffold00586:2423-4883(-) / protein_length=488 / sequence_SO=supercontig / SO=protein_coding / is_pseudo=false
MSSYDVLSELLSRELELQGVTEGSIAFDSFKSDMSEKSGRSRSDTDKNEYGEEVDDDEEEEEEEDVELDRILSAKIFLTSTRANRQTQKKSRSVFEYDTSSTFNSAKMRENSSVETTFKAAEMKERQKKEAVTNCDEDSLDITRSADTSNADETSKTTEREEDLTSRPALRFTPKQRKTLSSESQKSNQKKSRVTFSPTPTIFSGELSPIYLQFSFTSVKSTKENNAKEEDENAIGSDGGREALQSPRRRHSNHSLLHISVSRRHLVLSAIKAAFERTTQTHLRAAAENGFAITSSSAKDRAEEAVCEVDEQIGQDEGASSLHSLGKALFHLFNQLWSPQLPKQTTIPSSYAGTTGGILANDANSFLSLLCGTRLFSLGGEDTVRDAQLVENMRNEMNHNAFHHLILHAATQPFCRIIQSPAASSASNTHFTQCYRHRYSLADGEEGLAPHKISAIFETHYDQKPSSSPSMSISASLIQRLKVVGAA